MEALQEHTDNQAGAQDNDQVERRPCCGKCNSMSVYKDVDPIEGTVSIACMTCGNRYPGSNDFYMKEVEVKKPCKNCQRLRSIVKHGMCFTCAKVYDSAPEGAQRDQALADIKKKIDAGEIKTRGVKSADSPILSSSKKKLPTIHVHTEKPKEREAPRQDVFLPQVGELVTPVNIRITFEGSSMEKILDAIKSCHQIMVGGR